MELGVRDPALTSGNLETDLPELLLIVAQAAQAADTPVAIFVDEVQYLSNEYLSALLVSMHKSGQRQLPLILFGAGPRKDFGEETFRRVIQAMLATMEGLSTRVAVVELPGRHEDLIPAEQAA